MQEAATHRKPSVIITVAATIGGLTLGGPSTVSAQQPDAREITLDLSTDAAGYPTITVSPETATIWRNKQGKVKKIKWESTSSTRK